MAGWQDGRVADLMSFRHFRRPPPHSPKLPITQCVALSVYIYIYIHIYRERERGRERERERCDYIYIYTGIYIEREKERERERERYISILILFDVLLFSSYTVMSTRAPVRGISFCRSVYSSFCCSYGTTSFCFATAAAQLRQPMC